jgi:hypothetical protein
MGMKMVKPIASVLFEALAAIKYNEIFSGDHHQGMM